MHDDEHLTLRLSYRLPVALILDVADACGVAPGRPRSVGEARSRMGEPAFEEAWERGQEMTFEQVVAFSLP